MLNVCKAGDNFVSSTDLYGGTWNLFANTLKDLGVECRFVDPTDPEAFRAATDDRTRCYYAETLPNPKLHVFPIKEVADIGRELGVPLIMDNTATPVLCRPFDHGAAVIVYSSTKYMGGHGTSIGGLLVDGGNFDWEAHGDRFPTLNEPDPSYHGAVWTEAVKPLGPIAYIIRARVVLLRDLGSCMSPFNAFQFIQGLETLPLRMRAHCENAARVADYVKGHAKVTKVIFPSFQDGEVRRRADTYMPGGFGALVASSSRAARNRGARSSTRLKCSTTWPTSATRAASPSTRPPRPIPSFRPRSNWPPGSPTATCDCRWESSTSMISSPTWSRP